MTVEFLWKHYSNECDLCGECVDTCKCLSITSLKRIHRNEACCMRCETCSQIGAAITTEFI